MRGPGLWRSFVWCGGKRWEVGERSTFKWDIFCEAPVSALRLAAFGVGGERTSFPAPERMAVGVNKICTDVKRRKRHLKTSSDLERYTLFAAVLGGAQRCTCRGETAVPAAGKHMSITVGSHNVRAGLIEGHQWNGVTHKATPDGSGRYLLFNKPCTAEEASSPPRDAETAWYIGHSPMISHSYQQCDSISCKLIVSTHLQITAKDGWVSVLKSNKEPNKRTCYAPLTRSDYHPNPLDQ